jgi:hypothetical protein
MYANGQSLALALVQSGPDQMRPAATIPPATEWPSQHPSETTVTAYSSPWVLCNVTEVGLATCPVFASIRIVARLK